MTKGVITMNKKNMTLLIIVVVTLTLGIAVTATAGPDCDNPKFADHSLCPPPDPPPATTTTTTTGPVAGQPCETITPKNGTNELLEFRCDWTPENTGAVSGTIQVEKIKGEVSDVVMFVRDANPGDVCVLEQLRRPTGTLFEVSFPLVHEGQTYWEQGGTHWCAQFDGVTGERYDSNGDPLHVWVNVRVKKDTVVEISLFPGQAP
jgi:hypothetical protein